MNVIEVRGLVKRYRHADRDALDAVSFQVAAGQLFCLLGPNGAGKSTAVAILTTTLRPTAGRARVAGWDLASQPARVRREIGIVFQQPSVDVNLTAEENLRLHAVLYGLYPWRPSYRSMPASYRHAVRELAEVLDLGAALHHRVATLSGGTRRKLEIVRALLHRPRVLFLDEPSTGLDPQARRDLWDYLRQVRAASGTTIVLTTHYLAEAEAADAVCILVGGRIVEHGTPGELRARHSGADLELDAADRNALRRDLDRLGLPITGSGPLRVPLHRHSAQQIITAVHVELTRLDILRPSLEEAYLQLLQQTADP